jgi:hypothetical protein
MALMKTESGKEALLSRDVGLTPRMRQILVLANGVHTRDSIQDLMERDIGAALHQLLECGFLVDTADSGYAMDLPREPRRPVAAPKPLVVVPPTANPAKPGTAPETQTSRRSLAGTKMYMIDMLQLLRDMDASAMAAALHTSQNELEFIENVVASARLIVLKSGPSYGLRVVNKLHEIVPEAHLALLRELLAELEAESSTL